MNIGNLRSLVFLSAPLKQHWDVRSSSGSLSYTHRRPTLNTLLQKATLIRLPVPDSKAIGASGFSFILPTLDEYPTAVDEY